MSYELGVDLGTTFSTVAIVRPGELDGVARVEMADIGTRSFGVPSVLYVGPDDRVLVGEAAQRRAAIDPDLVVREVKRRLGDTAPLLVGGKAFSPSLLTAALLRGIVGRVVRAEGEAPARVMLAHPANWGPFRRNVFAEAASLSGLDTVFDFITEPVAAARWHARQERVDPGAVLAVYDLGGGTFDAAVLRKTVTGFELLGEPLGLDRLGGVDFDEAILGFVDGCLGGALRALDPGSAASARTMRSVRQEVVAAKEALSTDTAAAINVALPTGLDAVRITRREFEAMIEPHVRQSIEVLRATIELAGVAPAEVTKILLVGGSSRIPFVVELLQRELGIHAALDEHPKNVVALGAALALIPAPPGSASAADAERGSDAPDPERGSDADPDPASPAGGPAGGPPATLFVGAAERRDQPGPGDTASGLHGVVMVVGTGPSGGALLELGDQGEAVIGRDETADLILADPRVSRRHCRLSWDRDELRMEDLGALNHCSLDGVEVAQAVVRCGQVLRVGNSLLVALRAAPPGEPDRTEAATSAAEAFVLPEPVTGSGRLRRHRGSAEDYAAQLRSLEAQLTERARLIATARRLRAPVAGMTLVRPAAMRTTGDPRFLEVTIGFGDAASEGPIVIPDGLGPAFQDHAVRLAHRFALDRAVPVVAGLAGGTALRVIGVPEATTAVLRQVLLQVILHHSAEQVAVGVIRDGQPPGESNADPSSVFGIPIGMVRRSRHLHSPSGQLLVGSAAEVQSSLAGVPSHRPVILFGMAEAVRAVRRSSMGPGSSRDRSAGTVSTVGLVAPSDAVDHDAETADVELRIDAVDGLATVEGRSAPAVVGPVVPATVASAQVGRLLAP